MSNNDDGYLTSTEFKKFLTDRDAEHLEQKKAATERGLEIKEMLTKQDKMQLSMDSISKWRPVVDKTLSEHHKTLFGNGVPGWDEIIRRMAGFMDKQEAKESDKTAEIRKYVFWFITFVVGELAVRYFLR